MLECRRIRLLWGLSEIFKRVIKIFWGEVFKVRNTMKTGQPFLVTISEAFSRRSDCGYSAKRCEQKKKHKKTRGWGGRGEVCERGNWKFPTLSVSLFSSFFFSRSLPSRRTPLSKRLAQTTISVETLQLHHHMWKRFFLTGFDLDWPKPACTRRICPILQHAAKDRTSFVRLK